VTRELYDNKKRALYRKNRPGANNNKKQAQREAEQVVIYYRRTRQVHNKNNKQAQREAKQVVIKEHVISRCIIYNNKKQVRREAEHVVIDRRTRRQVHNRKNKQA
jgi:hypothetical protein